MHECEMCRCKMCVYMRVHANAYVCMYTHTHPPTYQHTHLHTQAALLRRGHEEYMKDEGSRSEQDKQHLLRWAAACNVLTSRLLGGLDALFIAATQGTHACVSHVYVGGWGGQARMLLTSVYRSPYLCLLVCAISLSVSISMLHLQERTPPCRRR